MKICKAYKKCGGCRYQGVEYCEQLKKKQAFAAKLLGKYGKISPIIGMTADDKRTSGVSASASDKAGGNLHLPETAYYRNKVHHVLSLDRQRNIISGSYEEGTHRVVPTDECMLEDRDCQKIIRTIRRLAGSFKLKIYNEDTHYGLLRHVLIRKGFNTGQIMVVLVAASAIIPSKNNFVKALLKEHPEITTIILNVNNRSDSMVLGTKNIILYGTGYIEDVLCGMRFRISPDAFYQINPIQTEKLYRTAIDMAELQGDESIIDAYCGIGTIGLSAIGIMREKSAANVSEEDDASIKASTISGAGHNMTAVGKKSELQLTGIELNSNAVKDAISNARLNKVANARFYAGDAGEYMEKLASAGRQTDVVFMDPPRAGSDKKFLNSLIKLAPSRIVYISCNPETQARDLASLTSRGYKVKKIQPVDMFPYTSHTEVCVSLVRSKNT